MKRGSIALVILLVVASLPVVTAQSASSYVLLGDDPQGDIDGEVGENQWQPMDLKSLEIKEDAQGFHFRLGVAGLTVDVPGTPTTEPVVYDIARDIIRQVGYNMEFRVHDLQFEARIFYLDEPQSVRGWLGVEDDDFGFTSHLEDLVIGIDEDLPGFEFTIPHHSLLDRQGTQPRPGDALSEFRVAADATGPFLVGGYSQSMAMKQEDNLPDSGTLATNWEVLQGVSSTGHLDAWSDIPVRVSNGEATTFLYEVTVQNNANYLDTIVPGWDGGLDAWVVTFPTGNIRLDAGESKTVPFLVTVPFAHDHGNYIPFTVSFQSQADPLATGLVELGVRYTAIPQPAGHHPTVYLHGEPSRGYFNTVEGESYPEDSEPVPEPQFSGTCSSGGVWRTHYPLSPGLEMGLDFDMNAIGEANWKFTSGLPSSGYSASAYFVVSDEEPWGCGTGEPEGTVAIVEQTEPIELGGGDQVVVTSNIIPRAYGDYVPLAPGTNLWFVYMLHEPDITLPTFVSFNGQPDTSSEPTWLPDSSFQLPLNEFHDDVDDYFNQLSGIDLYAVSAQQKLVNPGETTIFRVEAQNIGITESTFNLDTSGANTEWASLLGDLQITLDPGETRVLALAVKAPTSSVDGQLADITLHATHADDSSSRSLIRLLAEVDTDEDHLDETTDAALLNGELQEAPSVQLLAMLGALAFAWSVRRRI